MEDNKIIYKIVMYNDTEHSLYILQSAEEENIINKKFIEEYYYNKSTNFIKRFLEKDSFIIYDDIVGQLIDYHSKNGNDNYVERLSSHIFHNKIIICFDNLAGENKKNQMFPWNHNSLIYNLFLSFGDENNIIPSSHIVFVAEDQFNTDNSFTEYEYNLFYEDVKTLVNICSSCAEECERKLSYNKLLEEQKENNTIYKYPESITIHYGINNDLHIRDLGQVADWVENTMFDDNYYKDHIRTEVKDSSTVMQIKAGAMYIGDPNTGIVDVYLSSPGMYKSKYKS